MSIDLQLNTAVIKLEESNLQYLPAKLEATAEEAANVAVYFDAYTSEESNDGSCRNTLRGHPVRGRPFPIPDTHIGLIFEEDKQPLAENTARTFKQTAQFERFVLWNYDLTPSANDRLKMAVEGFCMAEELHKRVDPVELELFLLAQKEKTAADVAEPAKKNGGSDSDISET